MCGRVHYEHLYAFQIAPIVQFVIHTLPFILTKFNYICSSINHMIIAFQIARRYVFGKKSANVINYISIFSVVGLAVGTAALILVLSVFNGLGELISGMFGSFNPDIKVTPAKGKSFDPETIPLEKINKIDGLIATTIVLEDLVLFEYNKGQAFGKLKGVDSNYLRVNRIAENMYTGEFKVKEGALNTIVAGLGIADRLALNIYDPYEILHIYAPKRAARQGMGAQPFLSGAAQPIGLFSIQSEYDNEYIFCDLDLARDIFQLEGMASALEIKVNPEKEKLVLQTLTEILGDSFVIKNRAQQDEAFLQLQNLEKWMSYIILSLVLVLVAFNLVGVLWLITREKLQDISVLKTMGLNSGAVRGILLFAGWIYGMLGYGAGLIIALTLYYLQKEFSLITIPDGFAVTSYPIALAWIDMLAVLFTVCLISILSALPAAYRAANAPLSFVEN